ncbi:MAG: AAA family ATPase, partial [Candidatus Promineifilaceae bacterium]
MVQSNNPHYANKFSEPLLHLDLLGVPVISWRGEPLALPRRQARAVLYILAHEGKPLGREKLADLLWPEKAPAAARRNLARLLSLLRSELPVKELLGSDNAAVWLDPGQASCDVQDFQQLGKSNLPQEWKTAVSLYRGSFLDSFTLESYTFEEWQESNALDLERRYLETLAKLVKKLQAGGETADAISYARRYLAVDDLAETIHRALIALYAAQGERTAALQQYSHFTEILHRELGVEPLPETRAVFEAARDGQVSPKPIPVPQPSWSTLPGLDLPLVGRQNAWNALDEAYRQEQSGGAILISGAPGVGKSRLMQDFASRQSSLVLVGNCHTGSQALFFQPLVQALRQGLLNTDQGRLVKAIWLSELSILLPELREQYPDLPAPLPLEPAQSQARLLEAITQAFLTLAEHSPLLLCLDDLHAADEGTLAWLNYATRHLVNSRICLLVTYRTQESSKLAAWQRALSRSGRGHQIYLDSLDEPAVATLVTLAGALQETAVELVPELHEATGGNAYFLLETIRELLESGGLQGRTGPVPLPQTVREAVLRRADRLSPLTRQVLDAASVLCPLLEIPLLSKTSARSEMEVAGALDDLVRRQLLIPEGSGFRFQHDLTREAIYRAISDWRLRLLHRRSAQTLEKIQTYNQENVLG